jgi:hypothetical protein
VVLSAFEPVSRLDQRIQRTASAPILEDEEYDTRLGGFDAHHALIARVASEHDGALFEADNAPALKCDKCGATFASTGEKDGHDCYKETSDGKGKDSDSSGGDSDSDGKESDSDSDSKPPWLKDKTAKTAGMDSFTRRHLNEWMATGLWDDETPTAFETWVEEQMDYDPTLLDDGLSWKTLHDEWERQGSPHGKTSSLNGGNHAPGFYITTNTGSVVSGPYATFVDAHHALVRSAGDTVQYIGNQELYPEALRAEEFPANLHQVNGSFHFAFDTDNDQLWYSAETMPYENDDLSDDEIIALLHQYLASLPQRESIRVAAMEETFSGPTFQKYFADRVRQLAANYQEKHTSGHPIVRKLVPVLGAFLLGYWAKGKTSSWTPNTSTSWDDAAFPENAIWAKLHEAGEVGTSPNVDCETCGSTGVVPNGSGGLRTCPQCQESNDNHASDTHSLEWVQASTTLLARDPFAEDDEDHSWRLSDEHDAAMHDGEPHPDCPLCQEELASGTHPTQF